MRGWSLKETSRGWTIHSGLDLLTKVQGANHRLDRFAVRLDYCTLHGLDLHAFGSIILSTAANTNLSRTSNLVVDIKSTTRIEVTCKLFQETQLFRAIVEDSL